MALSVRQWRRGGSVFLLLFFTVTLAVLSLYYTELKREAMQAHAQRNEVLAQSLEQVLHNSYQHVRRLQQAAQFSLHNGDGPRDLQRRIRPVATDAGAGYTLDAWQAETPQAQIGNVLFIGSPQSALAQKELRLAEVLFPIAASAQLSDSAIQWTHYTSFTSRFAVIFPYRSLDGILHDSEVDSLAAFFERYLSPERRREATRLYTQAQDARWRPAQWDRAGAGWVTTLAAPVRYRGEVLGAVGADVRLAFLSQLLARHVQTPQRLFLADEDGVVLADSRLTGSSGTRLEHWQERVPFAAQDAARQVDRAHPGWVRDDNLYFYSRPLSQSPWLLISMVPTADLFFEARLQLLWGLLPLLIVGVALVLVWVRHGLRLQEKAGQGEGLW
jgi:hypothetical protein